MQIFLPERVINHFKTPGFTVRLHAEGESSQTGLCRVYTCLRVSHVLSLAWEDIAYAVNRKRITGDTVKDYLIKHRMKKKVLRVRS